MKVLISKNPHGYLPLKKWLNGNETLEAEAFMQCLISKQWNFPHKKMRKIFLILWKYTHKKKKITVYSQTIRPKLIWHQKIKTKLQGETNKNHSSNFFLLISMNHSKNFNAKIYNSSLSARCLQGYTREP